MDSIVLVAFFWGVVSAVSLPMGAVLGLAWKPKQKINSAFMAFGAGALLFALTIELFAHVPHHVAGHGSWAMIMVVGGALLGSFLFDTMNTILNDRGAFLRKISSAKRYVALLKRKRAQRLLQELGQITALQKLPPEKMAELIHDLDELSFDTEAPIFKQGDEASEMYFIISGQVQIVLHGDSDTEEQIATLGPGETFGEIGVLLGKPRTADAIPKGPVRLYRLNKGDFDAISRDVPEVKAEIEALAKDRLNTLTLKKGGDTLWRNKAMEALDEDRISVTMDEVQAEGKHAGGSGAAMAIWMGILIDGIPESLIIGILAMHPEGMSLAFIAGVFLANMPEAMSSAVSMSKGGMKVGKIMLMWGSLCLVTGLGAALATFIFPAHPTGALFFFVLAIEGLAAGAMLTMIAETMLPEAFEQGGSIVGISTLLGFLAALLVKVYSSGAAH